MEADEATALRLLRVAPAEDLLDEAAALAGTLGARPPAAWAATKARFREVALRGFDEAFRAAVAGQRDAYARGEPQAIMQTFLDRRARR